VGGGLFEYGLGECELWCYEVFVYCGCEVGFVVCGGYDIVEDVYWYLVGEFVCFVGDCE